MTDQPLDREAIRARYARYDALWDTENGITGVAVIAAGRSADDVPTLLAELDRLRRVHDATSVRGHCPGCDCPDVPYLGPPPTGRLVIEVPSTREEKKHG
jgi:hypothetical protein